MATVNTTVTELPQSRVRVEAEVAADEVERRLAPKRWRLVRRVRTTRDGRFRARLQRPGVYRVRAGRLAGAGVRLK